ncbi:MAG: hypothetical protein H7833_13000 [Magnetococcus sp. DMHC-1]
MAKIIDILNKIGITCNSFEVQDLDNAGSSEWDEVESPIETPFEDPKLATGRCSVGREFDPLTESLFRYFIDGSRKTYRVADLEHGGRYFPLIAAQVGVAVCKRDRHASGGCGLVPVSGKTEVINTLILPSLVGESDISEIRSVVADKARVKFEIITYNMKQDKSPLDLAAAAAMQRMHDMEVSAACELAKSGALSNDVMLVIDGSLMFRNQKFDIIDFRNVIGIAKRFKPDFTVGDKRKVDVGSVVRRLSYGERTMVFKRSFRNSNIGSWFLRIRPPEKVQGSLGGVVKLELFALGEAEKENGFDPDRVNVISRHVLSERNVTPYGVDDRWATHLYPVYLTETYLKNQFMSHVAFKGLF